MDIIHKPVLLEETIEFLSPRCKDAQMVDATLGEGGHAEAFLSRFNELRLTGIDADAEIIQRARERLKRFGSRIEFYTGWSQDFFTQALEKGTKPDTILIDLGISRYHYEKSGRGFSFTTDEPLDMRIDPRRGKSAGDLLRSLSEKDLADLLYYNADERYARRIAHAIKKQATIDTSAVLADIVFRAMPPHVRYGHAHPATKTFQALRIAVNNELVQLPSLLKLALAALKPGGRMGVISFHSGEDRIVKTFFRGESAKIPIYNSVKEGQSSLRLLTKKGIGAQNEEKLSNPSARSARLRVIQKIGDRDSAC
jgi:16S rRNA (cytosine1402-N4)-methyltransferase